MTEIATRNPVRRVFACWQSRVGAAALLALGVSWGADALGADRTGAEPAFACKPRGAA
jgi:hypothetical protein